MEDTRRGRKKQRQRKLEGQTGSRKELQMNKRRWAEETGREGLPDLTLTDIPGLTAHPPSITESLAHTNIR